MVSAGDFKNGLTIEYEGNIYQIIEFQHVKPGKGAAFVRAKLKNIKSGGAIEKSFRPSEKFENAHIERKEMQYLYTDGELFHFMDPETFDQVEAPLHVELLVTECEPGEKGNTAQGATKPCTVETGANVNVPLFVNQGDTLKIDTRTGEYLSRV